VPPPSWALKRNTFSVPNGTITHVLAMSGQHVAVLYFSLRTLAVPAAPLQSGQPRDFTPRCRLC
jgi:hypothetical protein